MFLTDREARFSPEEAARALSLPVQVIETLIAHQVLPETLPAREIEDFFRNGLLRLYHTLAQPRAVEAEEIELDIPSQPVETQISAPIDEYNEAHSTDRAEVRRAPRYEAKRKVSGTYRDVPFNVLEISSTGLRIRHDETIRPGDEARINVTVNKRTFTMRARVAWTTISQRGSGPSFCISGLRVTANIDHLQSAVSVIRGLDKEDPEKLSPANRTPPQLAGVSDDDVAMIIRVYRRFSSDPVEAGKWYARVRGAVSDDRVREVATAMRARDREEMLGIWEYLERGVDAEAISSVVNWLRQTRSAAAV
jgi:hypothetical protein